MTDVITTTLRQIKTIPGGKILAAKMQQRFGGALCDTDPLPYALIVEATSFEDALYCCDADEANQPLWRTFSLWCARRVQRPDIDVRFSAALDVCERFCNGLACEAELLDAGQHALAVLREAARNLDLDAAAHSAAFYALSCNPAGAAKAAAESFARFTMKATRPGGTNLEKAIASNAAWHSARAAQIKKFLEIVGTP